VVKAQPLIASALPPTTTTTTTATLEKETAMGLIGVLVILIVVGVLLYLVESTLPIDAAFKTIIRVVVILAVLLWLVQAFVGDIPIPRVR
jgi:hypothetical protein